MSSSGRGRGEGERRVWVGVAVGIVELPLFLLWANLWSVYGVLWHLLPSNCLISKHHVIIIKCVCVSGRGNLSEFTQWKVTCGELPIWQLVSRDLYAYLCPPLSHGQGVYVFSVQILNWLSVTGTRIIVYILMMSFWRGMALQLTDLHWYTRFYAISAPSGHRRCGQPTRKGLYSSHMTSHDITWLLLHVWNPMTHGKPLVWR